MKLQWSIVVGWTSMRINQVIAVAGHQTFVAVAISQLRVIEVKVMRRDQLGLSIRTVLRFQIQVDHQI